MALNPRRRILGVPLWAITVVLVAVVVFAPIGCLPGAGRARELADVRELGAPPACGQWLALSGTAQQAFAEGFAERLREREPGSRVTTAEVRETLARCARLDPQTDTLELLVPLITPLLDGR